MQSRRLSAALVIVMGAAFACQDEPAPAPKAAPPPPPAAAPEEPVHPLLEMRQAFGLPLPPEVEWVKDRGSVIEVGTWLEVDEIESFFQSRLVDYEFLRIGPNDLHVIGLHSTMPRIYVTKRARRVPISVTYAQQVGAMQREQRAEAKRKGQQAAPPKPGEPVRMKLPNGKDLAPGARYGEAYTPKPGDPLHTKANAPNFGKPFGEWVLN